VPHVEVDALGYGELALALTPRVARIEQRLRDAIRQSRIEPVPQSLADLPEWTDAAHQRRLIDEDERKALDDYARFAARVVKVDDFPADFGLLADLQRRKEALDKAMQLAA
jgi:acyl-CoA dehydrogenase